MPSRTPLAQDEIEKAIKSLPGWAFEEGKLSKTYTFGSFREAMGFIVRLAFEAEALDHHPELRNVYNRVEIALSTHDAGDKVTGMDVELAGAIEELAWV